MPLSSSTNLSDEEWRFYISSFVLSIGDNTNDPRILQQLREKYVEFQSALEDIDLSEQRKQNLHFLCYVCAIAILTWGQMDIVEAIFNHHRMLSHESHVAGQTRIATKAFNRILRFLLQRESQNTNLSDLEWYLNNKDKLEWNETLQRVVLKKSNLTKNTDNGE